MKRYDNVKLLEEFLEETIFFIIFIILVICTGLLFRRADYTNEYLKTEKYVQNNKDKNFTFEEFVRDLKEMKVDFEISKGKDIIT